MAYADVRYRRKWPCVGLDKTRARLLPAGSPLPYRTYLRSPMGVAEPGGETVHAPDFEVLVVALRRELRFDAARVGLHLRRVAVGRVREPQADHRSAAGRRHDAARGLEAARRRWVRPGGRPGGRPGRGDLLRGRRGRDLEVTTAGLGCSASARTASCSSAADIGRLPPSWRSSPTRPIAKKPTATATAAPASQVPVMSTAVRTPGLDDDTRAIVHQRSPRPG